MVCVCAGKLNLTVGFYRFLGWKWAISSPFPCNNVLDLLPNDGYVGKSMGCFDIKMVAGSHGGAIWRPGMSRSSMEGGCCTLAVNVEMGPVFHSCCSRIPLYSGPPAFILCVQLPPRPSANKWSFCLRVFAPACWQFSKATSPKTSGLSWDTSPRQPIIFPLSNVGFPLSASIVTFCFWIFSASLCLSITWFVLDWHLGWWIFGIPPLPCFWRSLYSTFYFFTIIQLGFLCFHTAFLTILLLQFYNSLKLSSHPLAISSVETVFTPKNVQYGCVFTIACNCRGIFLPPAVIS